MSFDLFCINTKWLKWKLGSVARHIPAAMPRFDSDSLGGPIAFCWPQNQDHKHSRSSGPGVQTKSSYRITDHLGLSTKYPPQSRSNQPPRLRSPEYRMKSENFYSQGSLVRVNSIIADPITSHRVLVAEWLTFVATKFACHFTCRSTHPRGIRCQSKIQICFLIYFADIIALLQASMAASALL